jgi:hypothetical protein
MKKTMLMSLVASVAIIAGGNVASNLPAVANVSAKKCHNDTVFVDKKTNLMWQDAHYTPQEDGAYKNNRSLGKAGTQRHAASYCRRLNYGGYSDWRLPTKEELSQVHRIPGQVFINSRDGDFWSATPAMGKKYYVVYPADAYAYERNRNQSNYIRCVRCVN